MHLSDAAEQAIDDALQSWRQGDITLDTGLEFVHFADLTRPHGPVSRQVAEALANDGETVGAGATPILDEVSGMVILSQTCDVVRGCRDRPYVEVAPLVEVPETLLNEIRVFKRPGFACVPKTVEDRLVADLDRTMTVEKSLVATWNRTPGCETDEQVRDFANALARKRTRFAFPDDFVAAAQRLQERLVDKHNKKSDEGAHLRSLREIRVRAAPSWDADEVELSWWFIKEGEPVDAHIDWPKFLDRWLALFDQTGRFHGNVPIACRLEDLTARDYVESDRLDLDRLSASGKV